MMVAIACKLSLLSALMSASAHGLRGAISITAERHLQYNDDNLDQYNDDILDDGYANDVDVDDTVYTDDTPSRSYGSSSTTAATATNLTDTMHQISDIVISQVQTSLANAQSKGYEFYSIPPSEWTSAQWDVFMAIMGGLVLACCFCSLCCAYCCIYRSYDDSGSDEALTKAAYHRRMLNQRLNRHRARYNKYDDDTADDATADDTVYTVESGSTYGQSSYRADTTVDSPPSITSSMYFTNRREQQKREEERKRRERLEREKRAADKRAAALKKKVDQKREALLSKEREEKKNALVAELLRKKEEDKKKKMAKVVDSIEAARTDESENTPVRSTTNKAVLVRKLTTAALEAKEKADNEAVEKALSYKMHP